MILSPNNVTFYPKRWHCEVKKIFTVTNFICEIGTNDRSTLGVRMMANGVTMSERKINCNQFLKEKKKKTVLTALCMYRASRFAVT